MGIKIGGMCIALLVFVIYMFVSTILNKLEDTIKVSSQLKQSLVVTEATLKKQVEATNGIIAITTEIDRHTVKLSEETKKNTYLITKGLKQNAQIDVDASINSDVINSMCLQWKAVNSSTQLSGNTISIPPNGSTSSTTTSECSEWKNVSTRESYEYTLVLLEHIGKLNNKLQGLDKYGRSLVDIK